MKISAEPETFKPETLIHYSTMCGWALARAHAKAGNPNIIKGYIGSSDKFMRSLVKYAESYADQVEHDFKAFKKAISSGQIHTGVEESSEFSFLL